jgi:hypothetical protein
MDDSQGAAGQPFARAAGEDGMLIDGGVDQESWMQAALGLVEVSSCGGWGCCHGC